jgi:hypothetical protein
MDYSEKSMAKSATSEYNNDKGKLPASVDEALIDEFCSLIAGIVRRISKEDALLKKGKSKPAKE